MCSKPPVVILGCLQILHRDIKTGNILLSQDFESAKICDVGLAHIATATSSSTSSSGGRYVQTTLAYAAPELLLCLRSTPLPFIFYILFFFFYLFFHPFFDHSFQFFIYLSLLLYLYLSFYLFFYLVSYFFFCQCFYLFQFCAAHWCI